jgi:hypothetical protein
MMLPAVRVAAAVTCGSVLAFTPAFASASSTSPPASITASPSRVRVAAGASSMLRVTNSGAHAVSVAAAPAGYAIDLRGRPHVARRAVTGGSASWLAVRPRHFALAPGQTVALAVTAVAPRRAAPGDHAALVLLATRPANVGRVAVALRVGVVVDVRVSGTVVRRLEPRAVRVLGTGDGRTVEVVVANRGNVSELLRPGGLKVLLRRGGRLVARLRPQGQELLPRSVGIVSVRYRGSARGWVTAVVSLARATGRAPVQRRFRLRL